MLTCFVTALILYGVPLYYSLMAVKMGGAAPEENKKWSVYWLVTFITIPLFYIVSFFGWYLSPNAAPSLPSSESELPSGSIILISKERSLLTKQ